MIVATSFNLFLSCPNEYYIPDENATTTQASENILKRIWNKVAGENDNLIPMYDYIPLSVNGTKYSTNFSIRFFDDKRGEYQLFYHNCFNYNSNTGYTDLVAVDFTVSIIEMNMFSYLSAGDILKPRLYLYLAFLFAIISISWIHKLCRSE